MAQNNNQESFKRKEPKRKFALWVRESTLDRVKELYQEDNCKSQSEFIEKAGSRSVLALIYLYCTTDIDKNSVLQLPMRK